MRALVAGGAGFVGSRLCARLLERGDEVLCVDNLITGSASNVDSLANHDGFSFVQADISVDAAGEGPLDAVFNLACPASPVDFTPLALQILDAGSRGVTNLLDLCVRSGARFLQASTSEVYGQPQVHPQVETYWGNVNPIGQRSVYDESKRFAEALTMAYHRQHRVEVRIARIFNTYGPRMRVDDGRVMSNFVTQALRGEPLTVHGDGSQTRSLCYVDDLVGGLLALFDSPCGDPVNLGNDEERTVLDIAQMVIDAVGSKSAITFAPRPLDDPSVRRPDLSLARRELGWQPVTPLGEGLEPTIAWFSSQLDR